MHSKMIKQVNFTNSMYMIYRYWIWRELSAGNNANQNSLSIILDFEYGYRRKIHKSLLNMSNCWVLVSEWVSEWVIKFNGLSGDSR